MPTISSAKTRVHPWMNSIEPKMLLFSRGWDFDRPNSPWIADAEAAPPSPLRLGARATFSASSTMRGSPSRALARRQSWDVPVLKSAPISWQEYASVKGARVVRRRKGGKALDLAQGSVASDDSRGGGGTVITTDAPQRVVVTYPFCASRSTDLNTRAAGARGTRAIRRPFNMRVALLPEIASTRRDQPERPSPAQKSSLPGAEHDRRERSRRSRARLTLVLPRHFMRQQEGRNSIVATQTRQEPTLHVPDPDQASHRSPAKAKRRRFWQDQDTIAPIPLWPPADESLPAVLYGTGDRSDLDARTALISVTKKAPTDQCAPVQLYDRNMTRSRRLARKQLALAAN